MKAFIITEAELDALAAKMELAFRNVATRQNQDWNLTSAAGQPATIYDCFRTANFVVHDWKGKIS